MTTPPPGIDIPKLRSDVCLVGGGGKLRRRVLPNSPAGFARLSEAGAPRPRKALYFPAAVPIRHNPYVKEMSERPEGRGKCAMQVIGAATRKLVHVAYGVLKSGRPFDPELKTA